MQKQYRRKYLRLCEMLRGINAPASAGAFFLWKNDGGGDDIMYNRMKVKRKGKCT